MIKRFTSYATVIGLELTREINGVEYPDIKVEVEIDISHIGGSDPDDGPDYDILSARVVEDIHFFDSEGNELDGWAFRCNQDIELTDRERGRVFEEALTDT